MDKRFWSGAILVVTVVVAGAGALPTLLLRPDSTPVADAPVASLSPAVKTAEPVVASAPKAPEAVAAPAATPAAAAPATPPVEPAREIAGVVAAAAPTAAEPPPPQAVTFPPVQPIGIATQAGPDATLQPTQSRAASARPDTAPPKRQTVRAQAAAQEAKKRKRPVRPAIYPLREFFAWRR